jgi:hypothetical protein
MVSFLFDGELFFTARIFAPLLNPNLLKWNRFETAATARRLDSFRPRPGKDAFHRVPNIAIE